MIELGDIVKFRDGLYADETGALYVVLEVNGDRVIIEYLCNLPLPPQSVARLSDLEVIEDLKHVLDG